MKVFSPLATIMWSKYAACSTEEIFSSNSEAIASELLENLEDMFPCYCYYKRIYFCELISFPDDESLSKNYIVIKDLNLYLMSEKKQISIFI